MITLSAISGFALGNSLAQEVDSFPEIHEDVVDCFSFEPYESLTGVRFVPSALGETVGIEKLVIELLQQDVADKQLALTHQFPADWNEENEGNLWALRLREYLNSSLARAAKCVVSNYQEGDELRRWSLEVPGLYEKGFVLLREGRIAVRVLTAQIWD